jgi:hypothetical protein
MREAMRKKKQQVSGEIQQIKVTLWGTEVWRHLLVERDTTLDQLHYVLQRAIGWENDHMHEFVVGGRSFGAVNPMGEILRAADGPDETEVEIAQVLPHIGSRIQYRYDFGDGWRHEIVLLKRLPKIAGQVYPRCIAGEHAGPPEDCGGLGGYHTLLTALKDPDSESYERALEIAGEDYDPKGFSPEEVTKRLHGTVALDDGDEDEDNAAADDQG